MSSQPVTLASLPSLAGFQWSCRQSKRSAAGRDGITGRLLRAHASVLAEYYYALQLECSLTLVEPLQWKGGFYRDLIKSGQADPSQCSSSRSILVSSQIGKASRRCLRAQLIPWLTQEAGETQFGGLPGRGTTHASYCLRLAQALARARNRALGSLFLDATQAFYRAIREFLICSTLDDDSIAHIVTAAGLPPAAMHELAVRLREHGASLERSTVDPHVVAQVTQCYQAPWFVCEGSRQVSLPQRSVFPGQPLADVLYELQMTDCMRDVRTALEAE
eukprot:2399641-Pyramimonas_sp.AAC.1